MAIMVGLPGSLMMLLIVEDNWTMDTGGASRGEWLAGIPLIVWGTAGMAIIAVSALFSLYCGAPLGRRFARWLVLNIAVFVAVGLAIPVYSLTEEMVEVTGDFGARSQYVAEKMVGNATVGMLGLTLLAIGWVVGGWYARRLTGLGRVDRR